MSTPQLPLKLSSAAEWSFETFIGPPEVLLPLRQLAAEQGGLIYLAGPGGSGKTHLALATVQAASREGRLAQYLSGPALRQRARAGLEGMEQADLVVLDDLDALSGEQADELAVFDFHNRASDRGMALIYVASLPPAQLPVQLPDLRSRLMQCLQLRLTLPDDRLRQQILQAKAQARGWLLDEAAIGYVLRRAGRDMGELAHLLERLDQASLAEQRRVTVPFIRRLLG